MNTGIAADEVIDAIAHIEMHRQEMEREAGLAAACSEALRKLHELLEREREAMQLHGPGSRHSANVEILTIEINRIKKLPGMTRQDSLPKNVHAQQPHMSQRNMPANPPRSKGRRTMGRRGDR